MQDAYLPSAVTDQKVIELSNRVEYQKYIDMAPECNKEKLQKLFRVPGKKFIYSLKVNGKQRYLFHVVNTYEVYDFMTDSYNDFLDVDPDEDSFDLCDIWLTEIRDTLLKALDDVYDGDYCYANLKKATAMPKKFERKELQQNFVFCKKRGHYTYGITCLKCKTPCGDGI